MTQHMHPGIGDNKMKVLHKEKLVLAGDLNGHVGESRIGFERWHGGFRMKGEIIVFTSGPSF